MSACAAGSPRIRRSAIGALAFVLAGCAVGPDFKTPAAPAHAGFTPAGSASPSVTASAPIPGGEAQRFVDGLDIPGQWWTLFQSPDLNALIERALKQNPTLESAQAALREADENVAAQRGALFPSLSGTYQAQRNRSTLAQFGLPGSGAYYYTLNNAQVNVSYTLDAFGGIRRQIEALQAQADYSRYSLEASYLALTANVVTAAITEASLRAQVGAQEATLPARSKHSSTSLSAGSLPAAPRAATYCNSRRPCRQPSRHCLYYALSSPRSATCWRLMSVHCPTNTAMRRSSSTP